MSWCDKLASTPTVGFRFSSHFAPAEFWLSALSPIFDRATETEARHFTVQKGNTPYVISFTTNDGFHYAGDESKLSVGFQHRVKYKHVSGGPPTMEMLSKPLPFTKLMGDVSTKLVEATLLMPSAKSRTIKRVGVISTTPIAEEDIPPGIRRFIEYLGRPWSGKLELYNISVTTALGEGAATEDRCIHAIVKPEEEDELLTLQFDWQRKFKTERQISKQNLEEALDEAKRDALRYFEDLAEGSRFDEVLIREAATA